MLSNWFCWIDWRPYNLTLEEVKELYHQYQQESGQAISAAVVDKVYQSTKGQPGLVSGFGELLTEKYNPGSQQMIEMDTWKRVWYGCNSSHQKI